MGAPRGISSVTKTHIREAARELFAERGIERVTIREIAAAAGVTHGLVHRYFGTKSDMVRDIVSHEIARLVADTARSGPNAIAEVLALLRADHKSLLVILRAELDGLHPEKLVEDNTPRPLRILAEWIGRQNAMEGVDPRIASIVAGAAVFGLAALTPWLSSAVGLDDRDEADVRDECMRAVIRLIGAAAGRPIAGPAGESA